MSVKFENIVKSFDGQKQILKDLSFELPLGKFSGLLGPSGCGKTTLLRILAGLDDANSGKVSLNNEVFLDTKSKVFVPPEKRNIGMVFQSYAVWPHMSVFDNVAFPLKIRKIKSAQIKDEVNEALRIIQMEGLSERMPNALSGGQQQRVALARALVQKPKLLLLDEPLSNLDASLRDSMRTEIRELQKRLGLTAVIVTHDWADARSLCDELVVMNEGKIIQKGSPTEIAQNPASPFVLQLTKSHG